MKSKQVLSSLALIVLIIILSSFPHVRSQHIYHDMVKMNQEHHQTNNEHGVLDAFSLSLVGNFNFAKAVEGVRKIVEGISNFIDLKVISAAVDIVLDRFLPSDMAAESTNEIPSDTLLSRMDMPPPETLPEDNVRVKKAVLKEEITTVVGAILDKQDCYERTACIMGRRTKSFAAKDVIIIMAEKLVPSLKYTLDLVRQGSQDSFDCSNFLCNPDQERQ